MKRRGNKELERGKGRIKGEREILERREGCEFRQSFVSKNTQVKE